MIQHFVDLFLQNFYTNKYKEIDENNQLLKVRHPEPKDSLAKQSMLMIGLLPLWKRMLMIFFGLSMLIFPYVINSMNIKMIKGNSDIRYVFCLVSISQTLLDIVKAIFMTTIGTRNAICFLNKEVFRYSMLSKQTTYKYAASKTMDQDIRDASNAINRFIEWGLQAVVGALGSVLSCFVILVSMSPGLEDLTAILLLVILFFAILRPIQKNLTEKMEKHQKIYHRTRDLLTFRSVEFQNKECKPDEYFQTIEAPFEYGIQVDSLFNLAYYVINLMTNVLMFLYAYAAEDDINFAEKYVVISSISGAVRDISQFGNHYRRYCNEYDKYYKMFRDENLRYDEIIPQEEIPNLFGISSIKISRGVHTVTCEQAIKVEQGKQYLIKGPSGAGKSTLLDAFLGYLPGIVLDNGINIRAYNEQIVVHLQHSAATKLTNVSIYDVFRSTDREGIREMIEMLIPRAKFESILANIGASDLNADPFGLYIEDKFSGGEKTRFFLARTLYKAMRIGAKIIFLDEPEDGQDPDLQILSFRVIHRFAKENGFTVFWITHLRENDLRETEIDFDGGLIIFTLDGMITFNQ